MSTLDPHIGHISTIFEHYSNYIESQKMGFTSPEIWDEINTTISRIHKIDTILGDKSLIEGKGKKPVYFPLERKESAYIELFDNIKEKKVLDVLRITFNSLYPNIIIQLCEEGSIEMNPILEVFYHIYKNYQKIKLVLSENGRQCLKLYINYSFGKLPKENRDLVTGRGHLIVQHFSKYEEWLYSDTDQIYIKNSLGLEKKIKQEMGLLDIPYEIEYLKEFIIFAKKKYVSIDSQGLGTAKGFKIFKF
jgi:hypothetical protein